MKYIILILFIFILFHSCVKKECQIDGGYNFEIPVTLSPAKDTFNIGDTITVISSFADEVYERHTEKTYQLIDFDFFPETSIYRIDTIGKIDNFSEFDVIIPQNYNYGFFNYSDGGRTLIGEYNYNNNVYDLQYKLIPKEKGLYYFSYQSVIFRLGEDQEFEGKCSNVKSRGVVMLNEGADNNIDMLNDSPDPHYNDWILIKPEERFHQFGGYVFYVKE